MSTLNLTIRGSNWLYGQLLRLYPSTFIDRFGVEMADVFEASLIENVRRHGWVGVPLTWWNVAREAVPTVLREQAEAGVAAWSAGEIQPRLRLAAAGTLPAGTFLALLRFCPNWEETAVISFWLACVVVGFVATGARGAKCLVGAAAGGLAGAAATIGACIVFAPDAIPPIGVALLIFLVAATAGLILSAAMRLFIEGVSLRPAPACA